MFGSFLCTSFHQPRLSEHFLLPTLLFTVFTYLGYYTPFCPLLSRKITHKSASFRDLRSKSWESPGTIFLTVEQSGGLGAGDCHGPAALAMTWRGDSVPKDCHVACGSCCGARHIPCRQSGFVICRPRPLAQVAFSATGGASIASLAMTQYLRACCDSAARPKSFTPLRR